MIVRLHGKLLSLAGAKAVIDVSGVGYEVDLTTTALASVSLDPADVVIHTHHVTRDDSQQLFGFATVDERDLFREVIKISGVGPRLGLAVLSAMTPADLSRAVSERDVKTIQRVPGIGKKTAERIVLDMTDRLPAFEATSVLGNNAERDAVRALVALEYKDSVAQKAVSEVARDGATVEELVRDALRRMAS